MSSEFEPLAQRIADDLFCNGAGHKADRLMLVKDNDRDGHSKEPCRNLGGWSKRTVVLRIIAALESAAIQSDTKE